MFVQRQGIIIYLQSLKQAKMLRKFGNIHFVSKRLKYVVLYCNMDDIDRTIERLKKFHFVKRIDLSYKPFIKTEYENAKPDEAKEYDYQVD
ncbi:YlbG family protein [Gottfriedia luciferensis]|uniref:YlbG family protein n=1 Tax=Gottfriedia luciferensis TaxID=178774 RepID=UPI000B43F9CA|nr:YlbG family protein [Gottfriedia luciferensis]